MQQLFERRVLLVTGKGGVGKSTVAAALARRAQRDGKRVLLLEFEDLSRVAPLFGQARAEAEPRELAPGLWLMGFDLLAGLHEFAADQLRVRALARLALANRHVRGFFLAMPAIRSVVFLYQLLELEQARGTRGEPRWDLIVCDMPTSGFVAGLFGVPSMVQQIFRVGPLAAVANAMGQLLREPHRTGIVLVALPEEMPVVETVELRNLLRQRHGVETAAIVVNGVYPALVADEELAALAAAIAAEDPTGSPASGDATRVEPDRGPRGAAVDAALLWAAKLLQTRSQRAQRLLETLRESPHTRLVALPHLFRRTLPLEAIDALSDRFRPSDRAAERS